MGSTLTCTTRAVRIVPGKVAPGTTLPACEPAGSLSVMFCARPSMWTSLRRLDLLLSSEAPNVSTRILRRSSGRSKT